MDTSEHARRFQKHEDCVYVRYWRKCPLSATKQMSEIQIIILKRLTGVLTVIQRPGEGKVLQGMVLTLHKLQPFA